MSTHQRLRLLEGLGEVPQDADATDWQLAERTSWWGRKLNPGEFWKGRVVWLDDSAAQAARRRGRGYPPPPYDDPGLPPYPNDEGTNWSYGGVEGPNLHFVTSSRESAFWDKFGKTMPQPPEKIARRQEMVAWQVLGSKYRSERVANPARTTPQRIEAMQQWEVKEAQQLGYPAEALTEDAMFWAYVLQQRAKYEQQLRARHPVDTNSFPRYLSRLYVDQRYITEPLTEEQVKAANAWKIAYLQRLRKENVDESYLNAYLQAWNLSLAEVFGQ
jgi:hypothetical protein